MTLDINMPFMDGVTFLEFLMKEHPLPVVMVTDYRLDQSGPVLKSLELGAFDYVNKGELQSLLADPSEFIAMMIEANRSKKNIANRSLRKNHFDMTTKTTPFDIPSYLLHQYVIVVGASTGGTEAIKEVFTRLPANIPPIVCVQHIPPVFSKAFADRLAELCPFKVKEAENHDLLIPGRALIAPGGLQMKIEKSGDGYKVVLRDDPPVNRFKPSVDYLFDSAQILDKKIIGVLMTGMGEDGARGLLNLKNLKKAKTIVQDEESSVVFGMPKAAIERGAACQISPLEYIAMNILKSIT
jgi:two-component system chemotaxis response regulator CheB